ncbi:uncharacterized protein LOC122263204 [Penaeus japonicus]|uniref:uncharacterized protein LOC122263204 n=1 Tax=Penaeus japonicus TaxID=27405 RepID=UPI001C715980|nr:uncharacterized protein LOC122263204 [Penaeus japonicus]XP_042887500.1 uncharacterized protein LOC122263204 [Penaeus japonicus]
MRLLCLLLLLSVGQGDDIPAKQLTIEKSDFAKDFKCVQLLCTTSADSSKCKSCLSELDASQLPSQSIYHCFQEITRCDPDETEALEQLRTCIISASSEMGGCITREPSRQGHT